MARVERIVWEADLDLSKVNSKIKQFESQVKRAQATIEVRANTAPAVRQHTQAMDKMKNASKRFVVDLGYGLGALSRGFLNLSSSVLEASLSMEKFENTITFATGQNAQQQIQKVIAFSNELGISAREALKGYSDISAAIRGTALEKDLDATFETFSKAFAAFRSSVADQKLALLGLSQLGSSAVVNMQDLRQIVSRIPSGMNIAGRAMNMTASDLRNLVATGKVAVADFLPKFTAELEKAVEPLAELATTSAQANINRINTAFFELQNTVGEVNLELINLFSPSIIAGIRVLQDNLDILVATMAGLATTLTAMAVPAIKAFLIAFSPLIIKIGAATAAFVILTKTIADFIKDTNEGSGSAQDFADILGDVTGKTYKARTGFETLYQSTENYGKMIRWAGEGIEATVLWMKELVRLQRELDQRGVGAVGGQNALENMGYEQDRILTFLSRLRGGDPSVTQADIMRVVQGWETRRAQLREYVASGGMPALSVAKLRADVDRINGYIESIKEFLDETGKAIKPLTDAEKSAKEAVQWVTDVIGFTEFHSGFWDTRIRKGVKGYHFGADYKMPVGTPISAPFAGTVQPLSTDKGEFGIRIVSLDGKVESQFWHMMSSLVKAGQVVAPGQVVGLSGGAVPKGHRTGSWESTGNHLDVKIKVNGKFMPVEQFFANPTAYFDPVNITQSTAGRVNSAARARQREAERRRRDAAKSDPANFDFFKTLGWGEMMRKHEQYLKERARLEEDVVGLNERFQEQTNDIATKYRDIVTSVMEYEEALGEALTLEEQKQRVIQEENRAYEEQKLALLDFKEELEEVAKLGTDEKFDRELEKIAKRMEKLGNVTPKTKKILETLTKELREGKFNAEKLVLEVDKLMDRSRTARDERVQFRTDVLTREARTELSDFLEDSYRLLGTGFSEKSPFSANKYLAMAKQIEITENYREQLERLNEMENNYQYNTAMQEKFTEIRSQLKLLMEQDLSELPGKFDEIIQAIAEPIGNFFEGILSDFIRGQATLQDLFIGFLNQVANFFSQLAAQMIQSQVFDLLRGLFGGGLLGGYGGVPSPVSSIAGTVTGASFQAAPFNLTPGMNLLPGFGNITYADGGMVGRFGRALRGEGGSAVPIIASIGEQVLSTRNGDAQFFRGLQSSGEWEFMKASRSPNFRTNSYNFSRSRSTSSGRNTVINSNMVINTPDAQSFRKSRSMIAQEERRRNKRAARYR